MRPHLIKQHDERDCGAACLCMIMDFYRKSLPLAAVRETAQVDQHGASIYGLLDAARKYGLSGRAFQDDSEKIWASIDSGSVPFPAILRIISHGMFEHFVVAAGIKNGRLHILDPDSGFCKMTLEEFRHVFLGQLLVFEKGPQFYRENKRKGQFSRYFTLISAQKKLICVIGLLSMLITGIGIAGTYSFRFLLDNVVSKINDPEALDQGLDLFAVLITVLAGLYLVKMLVQLLRGRLLAGMSKRLDLPLMMGYYAHVIRLPMRFFDTRKTGEIISRFNDGAMIREAISSVTLTLMIDFVMVVICGIVLFKSSTMLFCIAMATFLLYLLVSALYLKPLNTLQREQMEHGAQFSAYLKETLDGIEVIKSSSAETEVQGKTVSLFQNFLTRSVRSGTVEVTKDSIIGFITSFSTLVLLWIGAVSISSEEMTAGTLITFITMLDYFLSPVQNLVELQGNLQKAVIAADRMNDALILEQERDSGEEPGEHIESLEFDDVSFRYGTRRLVLEHLNFAAKKGQQIAVTGESGCGKSTASKLMTGLYRPESGVVRINHIPTTDISLKWLRSHTALVSQNIYFFSDTIRSNLLLGLDEDRTPSEEEIKRALDACCCDFVWNLPFGLDSMLEENAADLSGGQRQRLAIARALLRRPDLLILDEATSALDSETEARIQNALKGYYPDMIIILIAHRLSTVRESSDILVLDHGKVVEHGKHPVLLKAQGKYSALWMKQNGIVA